MQPFGVPASPLVLRWGLTPLGFDDHKRGGWRSQHVNMVKSEVILTLKQKTADVKSLELEVRTRFSRPRLWPLFSATRGCGFHRSGALAYHHSAGIIM